jgi:hypothetical protein
MFRSSKIGVDLWDCSQIGVKGWSEADGEEAA